MRAWVIGFLLLLHAQFADAKNWRVEKDGSGDFTVIQDALDAAAAGDSVLVGPGRYADFRLATLQSGYQSMAVCFVANSSVALIGAGTEITRIGPATITTEWSGLSTVGISTDFGAQSWIQGVTIENVKFPVTLRHKTTLTECLVRSTAEHQGLTLIAGDQIGIRDAVFEGTLTLFTATADVMWTSIERCTFYNSGPTSQGIVIGNGATDASIRDCEFYGSAVGISVQLSGSASIEDCRFVDMQVGAIEMDQGSAIVRRCRIEPGARFPVKVNIGRLEVYDSVIGGGSMATILTAGEMYVRNSHILNGGSLTVDSIALANETVDLRFNWWGTTELDTIGSWIQDVHGAVLYNPILDGPVPTRVESLGGLKARFDHPAGPNGN